MLIEPDFSGETKPMVAGTYLCRILSCEARISKNSNHYINWKLETVPEKRTIYYSTPIEGVGAGMFKHLVRCTIVESYESGSIETDKLIEKTVNMVLEPEPYTSKDGKQKTRFKVKSVSKATTNENDDIPF